MTETHDPYSTYMIKNAREFQIGDVVLFSMGERPLDEKGCGNCGRKDHEAIKGFIAKHNKMVFLITYIYSLTDTKVKCMFCSQIREHYIPELRIALDVGEQQCEVSGFLYNGILACINELTLVESVSS